jgi:2-polyprenyl-3-methyl-5-hydroxy-6-metoxy-1,4-benzoquinol methylase
MGYDSPQMGDPQRDRDTPDVPDADPLDSVLRHRSEAGAEFPRVALFLFAGGSVESLRKTLDRIPEALESCIEEIVVMPDAGSEQALAAAATELSRGRPFQLQVHRRPGDHGYGGDRKAAFEHALLRGFDHVVVMRGDGRHPPEALPALLHAAVVEGEPLVHASRLLHPRLAHRAGMPWLHVLGHLAASGLQNRILGIRLRDHDSGYRIYSTRPLRAIPFQLDPSDRSFDVELTIQHRALGLAGREVPVLPSWTEDDAAAHALRACATALGYRLHQLHVIRRGRYFVDRGIHYTLKESPTGSHMQIVDTIAPGRRVLDLGCSQGLLARPLGRKDVRVTGVDGGPPEHLAEELDEYFQRDLEAPLELPTGRVFDYVVIADVIEHLRNRAQLLRGARRLLKPDGRLVISTPNIALWFYRLSLLVGRFEYGPRGVLDRTHVHLYTRDSFRREVEGAGFHVLRERVTALPFEVVFESTGRSRLMRALAGFYHGLARLWPELFAYQIILEAEITTLDEEAAVLEAEGQAHA